MILYLDTSSLVKLFPIHLASAIQLKNKAQSETCFSSADSKLNQSAEKEGMIVVPENFR